MAVGIDVRRLAAIDMHGGKGRRTRARIILAEFVLGALLCSAFGAFVLAVASDAGGTVFGLWMIGAGMNYVPLALHAWSLFRPGALAQELAGVDIPSSLRFYTVAQLWVFVPLALVVFAFTERRLDAG